jgi:hypothetical protein
VNGMLPLYAGDYGEGKAKVLISCKLLPRRNLSPFPTPLSRSTGKDQDQTLP